MKKILVCTAGFGSFTEAPGPKNWIEQKSDIYEIHYYFANSENESTRQNSMHPRLRGKIPKMLAWMTHPDYDYYVWVDSNYHKIFDRPVDESIVHKIVENCTNVECCFFHHSIRNSVSEEVDAMYLLVEELKEPYFIERYSQEPIRQQYESYSTDASWVDNILLECGLFVYSSELVRNKEYNLLKEWFLHNCVWSIQDQISLPYLLYKFKTNFRLLPGSVWNNEFFLSP